MVTISNSTVRANVYETIYDALNSANLLSSTVTVTAAYIDDETPFPMVVVHPIILSHDYFSMDRTNSKKSVNVIIDVYTKKNKEIDLITDEIDTLLRPLKIPGLSLVAWDEDVALDTSNENKIRSKSISLAYMR